MRMLALSIIACGVTGSLAISQEHSTVATAKETIYLSTISADRPEGNRKDQAAGLLKRIDAILRQQGSSVNDVVHVQVTVKDPSDLPAINSAFAAQYSTVSPPARTILIGEPPVSGAPLAIQAIAVRSGTPRRAIRPPDWAEATRDQSYAILAGEILYLSGLVASNPRTGTPVAGEMPLQVKTIMENAGDLLRASGMTYDNLVSSRVWVRNISTFGVMNETYRSYWTQDRPTRSTIQNNGLAPFDVGITFVAANGRKEIFVPSNADGTPGSIGPNFSPAIRVGGRLFVSGNTGGSPSNRDDVNGQSQETLAKIGRTLAAAEFSFKDVVFTETWVTDVKQLPAVRGAFASVFTGAKPPAQAIVGIPALAGRSLLVEVAVIAAK